MNDSGGFYALDVARYLQDNNLLSQADYNKVYNYMNVDKGSQAIKHIQNRLSKQGYDGIVYLNRYEGFDSETNKRLLNLPRYQRGDLSDTDFLKIAPTAKDSYIAFKPEQIFPAISSKIK